MKKTLLLFLLSLLGFQTIVFSQDKDLISRLKLHLDILASDSLEGRGLGTDGAILARNYIAGQFSEAGLKPFGNSFFQDFRFRLSVAWIPAVNVICYI